ncbi:hypothetical protein QJQ45_020265, partial [Haematococcus lacustris]
DAARLVSPRDAAIARLPANIDPASPAAIELINLLEEQAWPEAHTEYPVYLHGRSVTEHEAMLEASLQRMVARNAAADAPLVEEGQLEDDDEEEELDERDTAIQELHASLQAREDVLVAVQARLTALEASQAAVNAGVSPAVGLSSAAPVRAPVGQSPNRPVTRAAASIAAIRQKYAGLSGGPAPAPLAAVPQAPDTVVHSHRGLPPIERWSDNSLAQGKRAVTFLEDLEVHCVNNNLDPALALPSFLSGKAREVWFKSIRDAYALTHAGYPPWDYLCKQFIEMVGEDLVTDLDQAHDKLMNFELLRMSSGVTLQAYITEFRNTITMCGAGCMNRALTVATFQRGLTPQLRGAVAKDLRSLPHPTLEDAVSAAIDNHKANVASAGANVTPSKRGAGHVAAVRPQISAIRAAVTPVSACRSGRTGGAGGAGTSRSHGAAATPPAPVIWCFHCGVTGHKTPDCPDGHLTQEEAMRKNGNIGMFLALQAANEKLRSAPGNKRPRPPPPGDNGGSAPGPNQNRNGPGGRGGRSGKGGAGRNGGRGAGKAREVWFKSIRDAYALTHAGYPPWDYLCKQFIEMVGEDLVTDLDQAHDKLMNFELLRMSSGVTLQAYITEFRNTITMCGAGCMNRALTVATFQRGLTPQLRGAVAKDLRSLPHPTLEDAVSAAIDNHKANVASAGANVTPSKRGAGHVAAVRPQISAIRAAVTPVSACRSGRTGGAGGAGTSRSHGAAATPPAPVIWCFHCGVTGHKTPDCPDGHLTQEEAMRKNGNIGMFLALQAANEKLSVNDEVKTVLCGTVQDEGSLHFLFSGTVNGHQARFLCDTGATHSFVSFAFAAMHALPLTALPQAQQWSLADNATLSCHQFAAVDLCLPGHCATCKLTVMPSFVQGYDVLLGDDWLFANKAILSYEGKTLSLSAAGKTAVTLPCPAVAAPKYIGQCSAVRPTPAFLINALKAKPELISATQASRWLLKGGRAVVALVMAEGSASASPGTPSDQDNQHIPAAIKADLQTLLDEYSDVFKPLTDTPLERPVGHTIPLVPDARPPVTPMYRLSKPEQEELKRQIQDYLSKGMIEPSSSPYAAPILFVQKKSGGLRMCIDYRQLNKLTQRDQYPLPRIDDLFDRLSGCSVFSSLDLQAGYHQNRITPKDVPKTAFRTPEGHFQFKVLSFGLTNAPATFQRVMNDAFAPVLGKCALVYLDDILVMSKSLPEHLQHLRLVFDLLRKNKLYAKMSKCEFMQLTLRFLGHVISAGAISVDPDKVRAIVDWPVPSSLTQLQSFLGAANFVRKFVHNFSAISAPLTDLCGKLSATFPWHSWPDHERLAFYELKAAVANVPMLRLPDHTQPFQVYCDASLQGVGAVLMQDGYPLAYLSKKLSSAEVNYTTGEQEMLALVTACKEWRCYLEGVPFTLFTDHKPLISLPTQKNLSRRQARWMELLSRFDFKLEYIPGPVNPADPLSRLITGPQEGATVCAMLTRRQAKLSCGGEGASGARALEANAPAAVTAKSSLTPEITENTADTSHNRDLVPLVTCTSDTSVHYPAAPAHPLGLSDQLIQGYRLDPAFNAEADLSSMYQDTHGLWRLTSKDKVVVPNDSELRNHILHEMHDAVYSGHVGISKTLERVSRVFWWNTMRADVRYYVSTCDACQRDKASTLKPGGLLNPLSIPDYRWESVSMDFITKLPSGSHGYDAICVFVDRLSKMVHFVPCREDLKARRFAQLFIDHVYKLHGMPAELISDRGSLFTSVFWREVMRRCGSKPALSSSYHPQSDGQTERYNRVLEEMLRHYISPTQSDWPDYLALAEFAVNNSWQESIQSTPFLVNTGQSPVTVGLRDLPYGGRCPSAHAFTRWWQDAVANARKCMAAAQSRQAAYANKARRDVEYKVGQKVLLSTKNLKLQPGKARKLIPRYVGPFEILLLVGAVAVKLDLPASMSRLHPVFHVSLIKPYTGTDVGFMPPPVTWMDETPVYYVERLLDHKGVKDNKASYYLVQWEGYDSTHNTWEPRSNLTDCDKVLAEYNAIHHLK